MSSGVQAAYLAVLILTAVSAEPPPAPDDETLLALLAPDYARLIEQAQLNRRRSTSGLSKTVPTSAYVAWLRRVLSADSPCRAGSPSLP